MSRSECIHELFRGQAERTPRRTAVVDDNETLTYAELDQRAQRLARALIEAGVGQETLVGIFAERGAGFLIAILAVWKAGGAYLPLDPKQPTSRQQSIFRQSRLSFVLTCETTRSQVERQCNSMPDIERPCVIPIVPVGEPQTRTEDLPSHCERSQLAYVIYTSGSTGTPKGAMVTHGGMLNHALAKLADLQVTKSDRVAQTAPACFDISVWQFLVALLVGGRAHVVSDEVAHDPWRLFCEVDRWGVTILELVPSVVRTFFQQAEVNGTLPKLARLRWLVLTGESLPSPLCHQWFSSYPEIPLVNAYGPTECSDDVTHAYFDRIDQVSFDRLPIGRALANTHLYVLDEKLCSLPSGAIGELYIGGAGVGRGYLHDPEQTAQRFVPDPFASQPGSRLYRTGDLASWRPDCQLEFHGRVDSQVKLRGFRFELCEIEAVLLRHPHCDDAVVLVESTHASEPCLTAYIATPVVNGSVTPTSIREYIEQQLPQYMVPSRFVLIESLPRNTNGKVDRAALKGYGAAAADDATHFEAPVTELEKLVAEMWCEILGVSRVGRGDSFFDLGGTSLLLARVFTQLQSRIDREVSVTDLFNYPTLRELCRFLSRAESSATAEEGRRRGAARNLARRTTRPRRARLD